MPFEFKINVDLELQHLLGTYEAYVPGPAIGELKRSKNKFAGVALKLAGKYKRYQTATQGDDGIIEAAIALDAYVVTNDALLRSKLRKQNVKCIFLRSRSHLYLEDDQL
jgi:rRNA-processing protein FCF1